MLAAIPLLGHAIDASAGLVINATYDGSVQSLSYFSELQSAFTYAAQQFENRYSDPISINIFVNANNEGVGNAFASVSSFPFSYGQVKSALAAKATTAADAMAVANLPANGPALYVPPAQVKALGLSSPGAAIDGAITFGINTTDFTYSFDPNNRAVANKDDFIGVAEHEIAHVLGRVSEADHPYAFDMFRYVSPGTLSTSVNDTGVYFSIDGGTTNLNSFDTFSDPADWLETTPYTPDASNAIGFIGTKNDLTPVDLTLIDTLGFTPSVVSGIDAYTGASGNWSDSSKWSLQRPPIAGDTVAITATSGAVAVALDVDAVDLAQLTIDGTGANTAALSQSAHLLSITGDEIVGNSGIGTFNQSGGIHTIGGTLYIAFNPGSTGTVNLSGGSLTAGSTVNNGLFNQTGGVASLGAVSGTGAMKVGGGGGTAQATVASFVQNAITINAGGTLTVASAEVRITNTVNTLTIAPNGLLDLQNHHLLVDNTATPFARVKQYMDAAYKRNAGTGVGDYNGRGGITSSVVKSNVDFMGVGYYNGALQDVNNPDNIGQTLGADSNSGAGTGIGLNQILVRPTLTGDLNGDGVVNSYDVTLFNSFGLFGQNTNLGYQAGDLNGDGIVNAKDVTIFNSAGNFNNGQFLAVNAAKTAKASTTHAGRSTKPATARLEPGHGSIAFSYDPATGDVKVNYNGFTGFAGKPTFNSTTRALSYIDILSPGGAFAMDASKLTQAVNEALSSPTITGDTEISLTAVNGYLPDGTDLGRIFAPGLDPVQLFNALSITYNYTGSRQVLGDVVPPVPEPTTLSLLGLGVIGLLARRRRNGKNAIASVEV